MIYYNVKIRYELKNREEKNDVLPILRKFNRFYTRRELSAKKLFIFSSNEEYIRAVLMIDCRKTSLKRAIADIEKECRMKQINYFKTFKILPSTAKEITLEVACNDLQIGIYEDYLERYMEPETCVAPHMPMVKLILMSFCLKAKPQAMSKLKWKAKAFLPIHPFLKSLKGFIHRLINAVFMATRCIMSSTPPREKLQNIWWICWRKRCMQTSASKVPASLM